jgi:hypothetical protein
MNFAKIIQNIKNHTKIFANNDLERSFDLF